MLANKERGELSLVVEGERYVLTLVTASMVELEDLTGGRTFLECWEGVQTRKSMKDICLILWTALRGKHPEIASDEPGAVKRMAEFIDRAGGLDQITDQLTALLRMHAAPAELQQKTRDTARPPDAAAQPGSPGDASASPGFVAA